MQTAFGSALAAGDSGRVPHRASLPLHVMLRTNVMMSAVWCVQAWTNYNVKGSTGRGLSITDSSWYASVIVIWMVFEPIRLFTGYMGNRHQSVAHLFGFLVFTAFTSTGLMMVFATAIPKANAIDKSFACVMLILSWCEFFPALANLQRLVAVNTMRFYVNLGLSEEEMELTEVR